MPSEIECALKTLERLRTGPISPLAPKVALTRASSPEHDLAWQLPASTEGERMGILIRGST
jgi:hypothetical protein